MDTPLLNHLTAADYEHVYEPAEDSFLLLDALEDELEEIRAKKPLLCVEIGSGSGVNITALAKVLPESYCCAVDINPYACDATRRTGTANGTSINVIQADLVDAFLNHSIDLLLFNPPYVPTESIEDEELGDQGAQIKKAWSGGIDGCEVVERLLETLGDKLAPGASFYLLLLKENKPFKIADTLKRMQFAADIIKERKIPGEHLFILKIIKK